MFSPLCSVTSDPPTGYNKLMPRPLSTALALLLYVSTAVAQSGLPANDLLTAGIKHLERAEYADALNEFEKALDAYAGAERLDDVKQVYMACSRATARMRTL